MLQGHGDNGYRFDRAIIADFSSNVLQNGEPAGLKEHLFDKWEKLVHKYPETAGESLAEKLSAYHGLSPENILVTNGATEAIYLLAQLFRNKRSAIVIPSFSEYEDACRINGHQMEFLPWEELPHASHPGAGRSKSGANDPISGSDLFWIGNPNNPTGAVFSGLETFLEQNPQTLFAVDEAFIEFTDAISSSTALITRFSNLVIFRSLTKSFAIPGLRLGYVVAHSGLIAQLHTIKQPWSVNALALEAGNFILDRHPENLVPLDRLLQNKNVFLRQLQDIGIQIVPGHTHFFLCRTTRGTAAALQRWLLDTTGLLIRDASNFRGLGAGHFRLATRTPEQNQLMVDALEKWEEGR